MRYPLYALALLPFVVAAGPCGVNERLTAAEAQEAVDEVTLSSQALSLTAGTVEITTSFTIGEALETAAEEIGNTISAALPCAEITLDGNVLTVTYGALSGDCVYNGKTLTGTHIIEVTSTTQGELIVNHEWQSLSDGILKVTGTAEVTWSSATSSRTIDHALTWTRLSDNKTLSGSGLRVQTALSGGVAEGIEENGERRWTGDSGDWDLDIDGVEMRWIDPVPQSGKYTLDTPFDKTLTLTFSRVDEDTIKVTVADDKRSLDINVSKTGQVSESK